MTWKVPITFVPACVVVQIASAVAAEVERDVALP
jgi:hypothetical protein